MTRNQFRKIALSFPEVHEEPHFERASFRVGKKIFATITADGRQAMVGVAEPDRVEALLKSFPDAFFSHGYWTQRSGALGVNLAHADSALLRELLTDSWRRVAPKRLIEGLTSR
jgi:hypothetical protein